MTITDKTADVLLFTPGRAPCSAPLAIVLHSFSSGIEMLDLEMERCPRPRPRCPTGCHNSFHYGVDGCVIHQYVALANTAWGFGVTPPTCPEPVCPPDECESCTGLTVAQYNPDADGNEPVLPVFTADTCGTANSCVIHVAVTGQSGFSAVDAFDQCCHWMEKSYSCFVRSLAQIFIASGLTPSQTTLLVHCNELLCIDIDQLVTDILVVINTPPAPPPPCQCTATSVTPAAVCTALATFDDSLVAATVALGPDCLFHPITDVNVVGLDTDTVNITVTEGPAGTFTVSADTVANQDFLCEQLNTLTFVGEAIGDVRVVGIVQSEITACGLFTIPVQDVQALDTATVNTTITEAPATVFTVSSDVNISASPGNTLTANLDGLFVAPFTLNDCGGNPVTSGSEVITPTNIFSAIGNSGATTIAILAKPLVSGDCPVQVVAPVTCAANSAAATTHANFNAGFWALTSSPSDAGAVVWRKLGAGYASGGDVGAGLIDVNDPTQAGIRYVSATAAQTINVPANDCSRTEVYIKNVSSSAITITGVGTTIDGVAAITLDGTVAGGYPFGNNGGESVHLVWNPGRAEWQVF